ncbi:methyl-accepting chemotaxis protein [Pelotomaculum isophthalicicum JI]|uniref:Methyl-accepting chemotaxis protein n=1 Tax=Pelotomaculum isophthalicicum JI TaxID=947010 RepID=A0A9X4H4Z1_9FIRM|nr:methyl-accepting chemotaxis protein [Pelotomaculum isophthalicicum]MDF9409183.1 methyl-accepting chemotaxis protein [Pelotomaculum isophthalicicum JI]
MNFKDMKIGTRLGLGFGLILILLVISTLVGNSSMGKIQGDMNQIYNTNVVSMELAYDMLDSMAVISRETRSIILLEDSNAKQDSSNKIEEARARYNKDFAKLREMDNTVEGKALLANVEKAIESGKLSNDKVVTLGLAGNNAEAVSVINKEAMPGMARIEDSLKNVVNYQEERSKARFNEAAQLYARTRLFMLINSGIAIILGIFISWLITFIITRSITNPLKIAVDVAEQIADRNLRVDVPVNNSRNEIGFLIQSFHRMVENLREETRQIMEGVNVLASSASEISASTVQFASGAAESAAALSETTATMEEVRQTVQVSSQKAKYMSEIAPKAMQASQDGQDSVNETIKRMDLIQEQMVSIAESIVRLSEQSQAIGELISIVDDVAEQSNLLAVNASIEAAKAEEHGQGFAVVAQEIKSLAEQSKQATAQVRRILNDIQKATSAAVMATEQGSKAVDAGVKQSTEASESIRTMANTITEATQALTQIAVTAQQQLTGIDQVAIAMNNIEQASNQNVDSARQLETAALKLDELGRRLKELVEQYQV